MSWKFVYNSGVGNPNGMEGQDDEARAKAKAAGYMFYMWNGCVRLTSDGSYTGIHDSDMF